ncbi:hypothetical protein TNCV_1168781 [Trichonephila clavipes]|uniref:Uncharacterized protein n=1 Tax=Trichonephila clavipes TaxID=2585209 RepID=A0A8X6SXB7_TRICX|nr:hypothetical protein TNCV_1168781 [Trichonephila clavipes]
MIRIDARFAHSYRGTEKIPFVRLQKIPTFSTTHIVFTPEKKMLLNYGAERTEAFDMRRCYNTPFPACYMKTKKAIRLEMTGGLISAVDKDPSLLDEVESASQAEFKDMAKNRSQECSGDFYK